MTFAIGAEDFEAEGTGKQKAGDPKEDGRASGDQPRDDGVGARRCAGCSTFIHDVRTEEEIVNCKRSSDLEVCAVVGAMASCRR